MASQITGVSSVCLTVCKGAYQRKHESSASPAFVRGIHRWPTNSPHKGPFDDVIMKWSCTCQCKHNDDCKVRSGPRFNIKTILRPSYLHNGISYTDKTSLYWIGAQFPSKFPWLSMTSSTWPTRSHATSSANMMCESRMGIKILCYYGSFNKETETK